MVQDIVTTVEDLRANILEKLDAVHALRAMLRKEYVPSTVCTHLEQCIKETEVSNMSYSFTGSYFLLVHPFFERKCSHNKNFYFVD